MYQLIFVNAHESWMELCMNRFAWGVSKAYISRFDEIRSVKLGFDPCGLFPLI